MEEKVEQIFDVTLGIELRTGKMVFSDLWEVRSKYQSNGMIVWSSFNNAQGYVELQLSEDLIAQISIFMNNQPAEQK